MNSFIKKCGYLKNTLLNFKRRSIKYFCKMDKLKLTSELLMIKLAKILLLKIESKLKLS